jgi:hypothetical protein
MYRPTVGAVEHPAHAKKMQRASAAPSSAMRHANAQCARPSAIRNANAQKADARVHGPHAMFFLRFCFLFVCFR